MSEIDLLKQRVAKLEEEIVVGALWGCWDTTGTTIFKLIGALLIYRF